MNEEKLKALISHMNTEFDYWKMDRIVDNVLGNKQQSSISGFDYEYVNQNGGGIAGDDFYGQIYLPLESGKFLEISYHC